MSARRTKSRKVCGRNLWNILHASATRRSWFLQWSDAVIFWAVAVIAACAAVDVFYNAQANLPKLCRTFCGWVWGFFACCKVRLVLPSCLLPPNLGKSRCTSSVLDIREYSVKPCRLLWKSELEVTPSPASEAVFQTEPTETGRVQMCNEKKSKLQIHLSNSKCENQCVCGKDAEPKGAFKKSNKNPFRNY